jgi:hypothetical protein
MALPKQILPTYSTKLPSTGQEIKFKPFTTKNEKALLLAQQSEELDVMVDTLLEVLEDCITTKGIDVNTFAIFDIEYMFLQIRSRSVGEIAELIFSCDDCTVDTAKTKIAFDLNKVNVEFDKTHSKRVVLFDEVGVMMKYPTYKTLNKINEQKTEDEVEFDLILECIDYIFDGNEIHRLEDYSEQEVIEFFDGLTKENFQKIYQFFDTMPKLLQRVKYNCPVCGKKHDKVMEGIEYFF